MKDRIRKVMESQNMTQQEFADFVHISPASLSSVFTGRTRRYRRGYQGCPP